MHTHTQTHTHTHTHTEGLFLPIVYIFEVKEKWIFFKSHFGAHCTVLAHIVPFWRTLYHFGAHCTTLAHIVPLWRTLYHFGAQSHFGAHCTTLAQNPTLAPSRAPKWDFSPKWYIISSFFACVARVPPKSTILAHLVPLWRTIVPFWRILRQSSTCAEVVLMSHFGAFF